MNELTGLEKLNKTRQELVKCYIECLEKEELPWRKGWDFHTQFNPITHIKYTGVNQLLLNMMSSLRGYNDPRWMTYLQIQKKGYKLVEAKGKGLPIEVWKIYDKEQKKNVTYIELINIVKKEELSNEDVAKRFQWKMRTFTVFNAKHIEGIEPYQEIKNEFNVHENRKKLIDNYAENTDLTIIESERSNGKCFYRPAQDIIMIPPKEYFHNEYSYLATLLHECCHSTLHEKRLNRLEGRNNFFGDEKYAIEELRAEISASFLCADIGLDVNEQRDNHTAYIQSWIRNIKEKPQILFSAINDAKEICQYIEEKGKYEELFLEKEEKNVKKNISSRKKDALKKSDNHTPRKIKDKQLER